MQLVNISGGADSTAMALYMHERGEDFEMIWADTGAELPEVYWFIPRLVEKIGKPLRVVSGGGFFKWLVQFGYMLPSIKIRWCTGHLKRIPLDHHMAVEGVDVSCVGIRADEPKRQKSPPPKKGGFTTRWPLVEGGFSKKDVHAICKKHGLENPVYQWRTNVSCFCCPFQRKRDWLGLLKNHPTLYKVAEEWERQSWLTAKNGQFTWSHWALDDLRKATKAQVDMWPEADAEPCLICTM